MDASIRRLGRGGLITLAIAVIALSTDAALTLAKGKTTKHKVNATVRLTTLDQSPTYPSPGSTLVDTGTVKSKLGNGAAVQNTTVTGHPTATTYTLKFTATDFYARGTIKASATGTATANADGSVTVSGSGHYTGGTGLYKKANGKFTFTGGAPAPVTGKPNVLTAKVTGSISY